MRTRCPTTSSRAGRIFVFFFFNDTATTEIYTLSLHDALPIWHRGMFLTDDVASQPGTFALVPQVVDAVDVPVIAAGGIADGRGIVAALALGAAAVQIGTAYLFCPEAKVPPLHRQALQGARDDTTALTNLFTGRPARGLINRLMRELGPLAAEAPAFPLAGGAL